MTSNIRLRELMNFTIPADAVASSVLILFYPFGDDIVTVFIQRPRYDGVHSGQISFPGGRSEPEDPNPVTTALREAKEEIGIQSETIRVLGQITDLYIPPSNFLVTPVVGFANERPDFIPDPMEVDHVLEVSLFDIMDDKVIRRQHEVLIPSGEVIIAPAFLIDEKVIWGATAMMLNELREIIKPWWKEPD
jgi:8-oxo-dGTP pyrophosphatase MutT (NUDIX family)